MRYLDNKFITLLVRYIKEFVINSIYTIIILLFVYYVMDIKINKPIINLVFILLGSTIASLLTKNKKY